MSDPEYFRAIGRLEAQVQALTTAVGELKTKIDGFETRLDQMDKVTNRALGGFTVILMLGAVAGFIIDHVVQIFWPR